MKSWRMTDMTTKKKMMMFFSEDMLNEARQEALRQDTSMSSVMELAWQIAREKLREMPGLDDCRINDWERAS